MGVLRFVEQSLLSLTRALRVASGLRPVRVCVLALIHNLCFAFFWRLFDHGLRFGLGDLELGECFLALRTKLSTRRRVLPLLLPHGWLMLQRALLVKHLLVLVDKLTFHVVVVVLIVRVLLSIHFFLALRHDLDVRRVHLHVGWAIVENGRRHNRHRVGQLT